MLDRSLSEVSASWDPLSLEEPADNGIPTHTSLEMCAELEEPGEPPYRLVQHEMNTSLDM